MCVCVCVCVQLAELEEESWRLQAYNELELMKKQLDALQVCGLAHTHAHTHTHTRHSTLAVAKPHMDCSSSLGKHDYR